MTSRSTSEPGADPLNEAVDSFVRRYRSGQKPTVDEYLARYPDRADELREILEALELMEEVGVGETAVPGLSDATSANRPTRLGDYRIVREIGRGGMGIVYEAEQESLGRQVALKVLPFHAMLSGERLDRFRREARAVAQLHHSNIVPVFGVGEERGVHYYAMQFIHGQPLDKVILEMRRLRELPDAEPSESTRSLIAHESSSALEGSSTVDTESLREVPCRESAGTSTSLFVDGDATSGRASATSRYHRNVARVGLDVADALAYAHEQGVLHRDIKPSNLLLDAQSAVWVTDFGLAKSVDSDDLTHTGDVLGTIAYMAPERFDGYSDPRSDIYSLGMTLYELLTLRPAFRDSDRGRLVRRVIHEEPPRPGRLAPSIPRDLETIVTKAIEKDSRNRYQSATALAEDLRAFLEDRPIAARRVSAAERSWRWCRRNAGMAILSTVAFVFLLVAGSALVFLSLLKEQKEGAEAARNQAILAERDGRFWHKLFKARANVLDTHAGRVAESRALLEDAAGALRELPEDFGDLAEKRVMLRDQVVRTESRFDLAVRESFAGIGGGATIAVAVSHDFRSFAVYRDGFLEIRRLHDRTLTARAEVLGGAPSFVDFSRSDRLLLGSREKEIFQIWDATTGGRLLASRPRACPFAIDLSPDEAIVALGFQDEGVEVQELVTGKVLARFDQRERVYMVRFDASGRRLAVSAGSHVRLYDVQGGSLLHDFRHARMIRGIAWSPRGEMVAGAGEDSSISIWDPSSGEKLRVLRGHGSSVLDVVFDHAGNVLASSAWDKTLRLWNPHTGGLLVTRPFDATRNTLKFSADDRALAHDGLDGTIRILDIIDAPVYASLFGHDRDGSGPFKFSFSPDGSLAATVGNDTALLWDLDRSRAVARVPHVRGAESSIAFLPSGDALMCDGVTLRLWPVRDMDASGVPGQAPGDGVRRVIFGPPEDLRVGLQAPLRHALLGADGRTVAIHRDQRETWIFDLESRELRRMEGRHVNPVFSSLSGDCKWLAAGNWGGRNAQVWSVRSGEEIVTVPTSGAATTAFSPDSRTMVVSDFESHRFFRVGSWRLERTIERDGSLKILGVCAFNPVGSIFVTNPVSDRLRVSDRRTHETLVDLVGPDRLSRENFTSTLGFSRDGALLASPTPHGLVQIWNVAALRERLTAAGADWGGERPAPRPRGAHSSVEIFVSSCRAGGRRSEDDLETLLLQRADWGEEPEYHHELAHAYESLERWTDAAIAYDRAIGLAPENALFHADRAHIHWARGESSDCIAEFERAATLDSANEDFRHLLGHAREAAGDLDAAFEDYGRLLDSRILGAEMRLHRAAIRLDQERFAEGITELEAIRAMKSTPDPTPDATSGKRIEALTALAWIRATGPVEHRDLTLAHVLATSAAALDPRDARVRRTLGMIHYRRGETPEAIGALEQARELDTHESGRAELLLALAYAHAGDQERARASLDAARAWIDGHRGQLRAFDARTLDALVREARDAMRGGVSSR